MEKEKVIELFNQDIEGEHGAIIQYLSHAYAMGEGEIACGIEALAREEMRHLDWLARKVVELGGKPSLKRGTMIMAGATVPEWMANNVSLEDGAIIQYREHIKQIDDPKIKMLLERILSDEESHKGSFQHLVDKSKREGMKDIRGSHSDSLVKALNWGIEHEYTVILQYLFQSYITEDEEIKNQLDDQAINEMQHLGWLAEELIGMHSNPVIEHSEVNQTTDKGKMLKSDIDIENKVADFYDKTGRKTDDAGIRKLLFRLRDHEIYHAKLFDSLLKKKN